MLKKKCRGCNKIKSLDNYYDDENMADNKKNKCKICMIVDRKIYLANNKEKILEYQAAYREKNRIMMRIRWKEWAKKNKDRRRLERRSAK